MGDEEVRTRGVHTDCRGGEGRGAELPVEGLLLQHYMQVLLGVPIW